jgi:Tetratricopeptide repeat
VTVHGGDTAGALELYERAAGLMSDRHPELTRDVYTTMAELLEQDGRAEEAREVLERVATRQAGARRA